MPLYPEVGCARGKSHPCGICSGMVGHPEGVQILLRSHLVLVKALWNGEHEGSKVHEMGARGMRVTRPPGRTRARPAARRAEYDGSNHYGDNDDEQHDE